MLPSVALAFLAAAGALAAPCSCVPPTGEQPAVELPPANEDSTHANLEAFGVTTAQLLAIMPTSGTCENSTECRTSGQAKPYINEAFSRLNIASKAEQAAVIALMAFESGELKFNTNQAGVVGQGTRNMQSGQYNLKYAEGIPELGTKLAEIGTEDLNAVRELVLPDKYSFKSASWFLVTQCHEVQRAELQKGTRAGWELYITECVGTDPAPRSAYWETAMKELGVEIADA